VRAFEDELDYVLSTLRRFGVAPADLEDLAQDVFVVVWRRWGDYRSDRPLRPWLAGIAFRLATKYRARRRREVAGLELDVRDETPLPDERVATARTRDLARRAIDQLPDRHRAAIVLHELDGIPMRELAALWGVPLFTAYTRVRTARRVFERLVDALQGAGAATAAPLSVEAVLAGGRVLDPTAAPARRRLGARLRALLLLPPAQRPRPQTEPVAPVAGEGAAAATGAAGRWLPWMAGGVIGVAALSAILLTRPARRPVAPPPGAPERAAAPRAVNPHHPPRRPAPPVFVVPAGAAPAEARPAPTSPGAALARGLVGYWRFDEGAGSAVAHDLSGRRNDCVFKGLDSGSAWIDGHVTGALRFGKRGRLECPAPELQTRPTDELTVAAWIRPSHLGRYHRTVLVRPLGETRSELYAFTFGGRDLLFRSGAYGTFFKAPFPAPPGHWVHVAVTRGRDGTARLFFGGVRVAQAFTRARPPARVTTPLVIGSTAEPRDAAERMRGQFEGALDELVIYDRALSAEEISWLAAGTQPHGS
jgi:RNA polymerase sigma-70 factor (ECF subfamily)